MLSADSISQFLDLICLGPLPFIYFYDISCPKLTCSKLASSISERAKESKPRLHHVAVDGVACFTSRMLFDTIINGLASWEPTWNEGCSNWNMTGTGRYNESLDSFLHGIKAVFSHLQRENSNENVRLVLVFEMPERIRERLPDVIVPLSRLAEITKCDISVVFISETRWEDIKPPLGASLDPFYVDVPVPTKEELVQYLSGVYSTIQQHEAYQTFLHPMYIHFISLLCETCHPYIKNPFEIQYIAAARWPGYIKPVLDAHKRDIEVAIQNGSPAPEPMLPPEDVRMRLQRSFKSSLTNAMEQLYPRLTNAARWARENEPEDGSLDRLLQTARNMSPSRHGYGETESSLVDSKDKQKNTGLETLSRMSKFILVASYLASMNPAKTDLRMFGRGVDEKKRRRRANKTKASAKPLTGPVKIPQQYTGPLPFPLDRMIAILGALLENNDVDTRLNTPDFDFAGEHTDLEITRVGVSASIVELTVRRLLHRTTAAEKLDGPPMFKCAIAYEVALELAKETGVNLNELLWDPM